MDMALIRVNAILTSFQNPMRGWCVWCVRVSQDSTIILNTQMFHVWDHFDFTQDIDWFKAQGWPLLKVPFDVIMDALLLMLDTSVERRSVPSAKTRSGPTLQ